MFEYKVVPAPKRGVKAKGVKGAEARFANALQAVMNEHGQEGWEYVRTDTLPSEEREGLMGRTTVFQNMLVFKRDLKSRDETTELAADIVEEETPLLEDKSNEIEAEQAPKPDVEPEVKADPTEAEAPAKPASVAPSFLLRRDTPETTE